MANRIDDIDRQLAQLKARRALLIAQQGSAERRRRTRQAIIVGTWLMAKRPELIDQIKSQLVRPQDRRAFGLPETDIAIPPATGG